MIDKTFQKLNQESAKYIVWKDTYNVTSFARGNGELDLLVAPECKSSFEKIIFSESFTQLQVKPLLRKSGINHYIRYENGKYFHLHVYFLLRTGNHYVKEYCLNVVPEIYTDSILVSGVKTVGIIDELSLLVFRLSIKQSVFFASHKRSELERLNVLINKVSADQLKRSLSRYCSNISDGVDKLYEAQGCPHKQSIELRKLKDQFSEFRIKSVARFYSSLFVAKLYLLILRAQRTSNKVLPSRGITIAMLGTDGSGKSTIVSNVSNLLSAKTSSKTIYLGGNSSTYSPITRLYFYMYKVLRVFSPFKHKYYLAWFFYNLGLCLLEYGKAQDRVRRIAKGQRLKDDGWIVIFERFPIVGLFDFPNKLYVSGASHGWEERLGGKLVSHLLGKIKKLIEEVSQPDLMFLLTVKFETMQMRRHMSGNEVLDIRNKLAVQSNYLSKPGNSIKLIDNNRELDDAYFEITNSINTQLCKFN